MSNTVFILGAGASQVAGVPLMGQFLDVAGDLFKRGEVPDYEQEFQMVFKAMASLSKVHSKANLDFQNVESVFAAFEMGKLLGGFGEYEKEAMDKLISAMKTVIVKTIEMTMRFPFRNKLLPPSPYVEFMELLKFLRNKANPKESVAIVTFNYDPAIDVSLTLNGLAMDYGLHSLQTTKMAANAVPLLKLHGSLNWGSCSKCDFIVPLDIRSALQTMDWQPLPGTEQVRLQLSLRVKALRHDICGNDCRPEPVIVPPTWNKAGYHSHVSPVWARAARELSEAENIFVIGYSLPESDMFFKYLYGLGTVGERILRRFWVINPDPTGEVMPKFETLLGPGAKQRFKPLTTTFRKSISEIRKEFE